MYGLKQVSRAWYEILLKFLLEQGVQEVKLALLFFFFKTNGKDLLIMHVFVDDIIFGSTDDNMTQEYEILMNKLFEMSIMVELNFFIGLLIKQTPTGTLIHQ